VIVEGSKRDRGSVWSWMAESDWDCKQRGDASASERDEGRHGKRQRGSERGSDRWLLGRVECVWFWTSALECSEFGRERELVRVRVECDQRS
jgi:hypothetical protein